MTGNLPPILNQPPSSIPFRYAATIEVSLEAAHQLHLPYHSPCNRKHGHSYRIRVVIAATGLDANGMIVDFTKVKVVIRQYDHQDLNESFTPTTVEKFGEILLDSLQTLVQRENPHATVTEIAISETGSTWMSIQYETR